MFYLRVQKIYFLSLIITIIVLLGACNNNNPTSVTTTPTLSPSPLPQTDILSWDVALKSETTIDVYLPVQGQVEIMVEALNTGAETWDNQPLPNESEDEIGDNVSINYRYYQGDNGIERLENCIGEDWCYTLSAFHCSDWVSLETPEPDTTPIPSKHRLVYVTDETAPEEIGYFQFHLCHNEAYNTLPRTEPYIEHYDLAHGGVWFYQAGMINNLTVRVFVIE